MIGDMDDDKLGLSATGLAKVTSRERCLARLREADWRILLYGLNGLMLLDNNGLEVLEVYWAVYAIGTKSFSIGKIMAVRKMHPFKKTMP